MYAWVSELNFKCYMLISHYHLAENGNAGKCIL